MCLLVPDDSADNTDNSTPSRLAASGTADPETAPKYYKLLTCLYNNRGSHMMRSLGASSGSDSGDEVGAPYLVAEASDGSEQSEEEDEVPELVPLTSAGAEVCGTTQRKGARQVGGHAKPCGKRAEQSEQRLRVTKGSGKHGRGVEAQDKAGGGVKGKNAGGKRSGEGSGLEEIDEGHGTSEDEFPEELLTRVREAAEGLEGVDPFDEDDDDWPSDSRCA
jgi:hypothetical protein